MLTSPCSAEALYSTMYNVRVYFLVVIECRMSVFQHKVIYRKYFLHRSVLRHNQDLRQGNRVGWRALDNCDKVKRYSCPYAELHDT
jgi:hypothetical protein